MLGPLACSLAIFSLLSASSPLRRCSKSSWRACFRTKQLMCRILFSTARQAPQRRREYCIITILRYFVMDKYAGETPTYACREAFTHMKAYSHVFDFRIMTQTPCLKIGTHYTFDLKSNSQRGRLFNVAPSRTRTSSPNCLAYIHICVCMYTCMHIYTCACI